MNTPGRGSPASGGRTGRWRLAGLLALGWMVHVAAAQATLTQADLLRRMIDLDRLMIPPAPGERALLFSSWDRAQRETHDGRYVKWDADGDAGHFLRSENGWDVLAETEGPGVITRIWVDKPTGQLRLLIDGRAVVAGAMGDVFEGGIAPFGAPFCDFSGAGEGGNCRLPIGFQKSLRLECQGYGGAYQVDVTRLGPGVSVAPFNPKFDEPAEAALREVAATLKRGFTDKQLLGGKRISSQGSQQDIAPRSKLTWPIDSPGVIRSLYVATTDRIEPKEVYALHQVIIRITTDGSEAPDVEAPLAEFFGVGFERQRYNSLMMGTDRWTDMPGEFPPESWFMYSFFPIPFSSVRIELENRTSKKLGLLLLLKVDRDRAPENALRFRARYRVEDPCKTFDVPVLETSGRGRLVGCGLSIDCPRPEWWGAGDHKMWIDGESFPSVLGTGTSHYFGNLAHSLTVSHGAFQGVTLAAPFGKNSLYRWHVADAVSFEKSLRFTIENWQAHQKNDVYYGTMAYWYGEAAVAAREKPLSIKELKTPGLRIPGSVEIEGRVRGENWGAVVEQERAGGVEFSGLRAVRIATDQPVLIELPASAAGRYRLGLRTHPQRSFGTVEVRGEGGVIGKVAYRRAAAGQYDIGEVPLKAGGNSITIVCDRPAILDCWTLEKVE